MDNESNFANLANARISLSRADTIGLTSPNSLGITNSFGSIKYGTEGIKLTTTYEAEYIPSLGITRGVYNTLFKTLAGMTIDASNEDVALAALKLQSLLGTVAGRPNK